MHRWFVLSLLLVCGGFGCRRAADVPPSSARPLLWAADAEGGAPFIFKDPQNPEKNIGFEVDLADALARELGRPIAFKQYEFNSLISGLERGDFDFAMNGLEITPDREKKVRFSKPYYVYKQQLVVRKDEERIRSFDDLKGRKDLTVGTLEDTAAQRLLDRNEIPTRIYTGQVEPYQDLGIGRVDAVLLDLPIALYYARKDPKLKFVGEPLAPGYYAIAFRRQDEALAKQVDEALERLRTSGELRRIFEKWGIWNEDQQELGRGS